MSSDAADTEPNSRSQRRRYLTTKEAALYLNVSTQFLEICRHRGIGPTYSKAGRAVRYAVDWLDEWMLLNQRKAS